MRRFWVGGTGLLSVLIGIYSVASGCTDLEETQFGNPNTLSRQNLPGEGGANVVTPVFCAGDDGTGGGTFDGGCPSFALDIYPYMTATGKWRCSDPACHGGVSSPHMDCDDPDKCFTSLTKISVESKPYINPDAGPADLSTTRMMCSLQGGCGDKMPKPPGADLTNNEFCTVEAWLKCGSPR